MDANPHQRQKALVFRFVCSSDAQRYEIISQDLDSLLAYAEDFWEQDYPVDWMLLVTAYSMYARYTTSIHAFAKLYRDVHGPQLPFSGETPADRLFRMADLMGYSVDAVWRFFATFALNRSVIHDRFILEAPLPDHPSDHRLNIAEDLLQTNEWYMQEYGASTMVPDLSVKTPACEQCLDSSEACVRFPGATRNGCAPCAVRSRPCSLLNHGLGGVHQDVEHAVRELSAQVSRLNATARGAHTLPPRTGDRLPSMDLQVREDA
ncbi:hypothetical protein K525DRAFT_274485 [Schizophyllum commune Loenen D]|nr:hypothetical protein K525DRAFT_274485 [Schizophyllum commune Loenen D]